MSYYSDLDNDRFYEHEQSVRAAEDREETILGIKGALMELSDEALISFVLKRGERMNRPGLTFQVYDVCKKLRDRGWSPTVSQRRAIINVAAIAAYDTGYVLEAA